MKPVAKAKPRPVPVNERIWIDIDAQPFNYSCFEVSKYMTRTLRHDSSIPRESDGAVRFDDLIEKLKVKFADKLQWTVSTWVNSLAKGEGMKKRFQYYSYSSNKFLYYRAIQGHAGDMFVDPALQDNALLQDDFKEYIYHTGNTFEMHSINKSGLIPGGQSNKKGQTVSVLHSRQPGGCSTRSGRS